MSQSYLITENTLNTLRMLDAYNMTCEAPSELIPVLDLLTEHPAGSYDDLSFPAQMAYQILASANDQPEEVAE